MKKILFLILFFLSNIAFPQKHFFYNLISLQSSLNKDLKIQCNPQSEREFLFYQSLLNCNYASDESKIRIFDSLIIFDYFNGQMVKSKISFIYNDKNKVSSLIWYDNVGITGLRFNYYYDNNDFLVKFREEFSDYYFEVIKERDKMGRLLQEVSREGVIGNDSLRNISRTTYKNDSTGNPVESIDEIWVDNNWVLYEKSISDYSAENLNIGLLIQAWQDNAWVDKAFFQFDYDNEKRLKKSMYQNFTEGRWNLNSIADFYYYSSGDTNTTEIIAEGFENNISVVKSRYTYNYDMFDFIISGKSEIFYNNNWILSAGIISLSNPDGFELHIIATQILAYYKNGYSSNNEDNIHEQGYLLSQNYPNPFNPSTTISFVIPNEVRNLNDTRSTEYYSVLQNVTLKVYDVLGREVATLVNEQKPAGNYEVTFDASGLSSGIYFYRLEAGSFAQTRKMILMK